MKNFIERLEKLKFSKSAPLTDMYNLAITDAIVLYEELHPSTEIPAPEPNKAENLPSFKVRVINSNYFYTVGDVYENVTSINDCGVEKWKVVNERGWYVGNLNKSDCEIIPETQTIAFDYKRWKDGDFLRVVTRDGREVTQLREFDADIFFPICGVLGHKIDTWSKSGSNTGDFCSDKSSDLHLEIATPPKKQVTTYHWVDSTGVCKGFCFQ